MIHTEIGEQPSTQQKQSKKDKKKAKQNQQKQRQPQTQSANQQNDSSSGNKLQEIIQQAQKTVQDALLVGTGNGQNETETELRKKIFEQEKRLKKLERISQQVCE
jgi:hypothetical protein